MEAVYRTSGVPEPDVRAANPQKQPDDGGMPLHYHDVSLPRTGTEQ